ncbi:hypothetical protein L1765_00310 [Microaerobacter geothermalis]|uniref:hypothetical protein n=1 Tax=Microaerobacter geothermalis TaxID=674972 RepID=UPI001F47D856|nr:hypothetical protein [Microaerobacter geothermalis]MCF6092433.1 hypothetical protein [Microaerobacter geothermalis]
MSSLNREEAIFHQAYGIDVSELEVIEEGKYLHQDGGFFFELKRVKRKELMKGQLISRFVKKCSEAFSQFQIPSVCFSKNGKAMIKKQGLNYMLWKIPHSSYTDNICPEKWGEQLALFHRFSQEIFTEDSGLEKIFVKDGTRSESWLNRRKRLLAWRDKVELKNRLSENEIILVKHFSYVSTLIDTAISIVGESEEIGEKALILSEHKRIGWDGLLYYLNHPMDWWIGDRTEDIASFVKDFYLYGSYELEEVALFIESYQRGYGVSFSEAEWKRIIAQFIYPRDILLMDERRLHDFVLSEERKEKKLKRMISYIMDQGTLSFPKIEWLMKNVG